MMNYKPYLFTSFGFVNEFPVSVVHFINVNLQNTYTYL